MTNHSISLRVLFASFGFLWIFDLCRINCEVAIKAQN